MSYNYSFTRKAYQVRLVDDLRSKLLGSFLCLMRGLASGNRDSEEDPTKKSMAIIDARVSINRDSEKNPTTESMAIIDVRVSTINV